MLRPHGNAGELHVQPFNPDLPNLQEGGDVHLLGERRRIRRVRHDRGQVLLQLEGIARRGEVEDARGALLEVAEAEVVREPETYFVYELVGLEVVTEAGRSLGRVSEVLSTGANDVYVITGPQGETLLPAIASVVQAVDVAGGVIRVAETGEMGDEGDG